MSLRKLLLILLPALVCSQLFAQDSDALYRKLPQEGFVLYFLSPTSFKAKPGKVRLETDFTFQYRDQRPDSVDMKFSLFSKKPVRGLDSLVIFSGTQRLGATNTLEIMFLQKDKGKWHSRFSTPIPYSTLEQMLSAGPGLAIKIYAAGLTLNFPAGKDWREAAEVLKEILAVEIGTGG
ncbi:MAG: hypothetical protein KDC66_16300 [Phaeodactylibacter sp.]|nr:hypothetical protein [Phaeodactylibacter sp.]MCB9273517.1 hypothetical protein [Lewinellaceae bacterium]